MFILKAIIIDNIIFFENTTKNEKCNKNKQNYFIK